jgi:SAM-dependent methyltransferase
MNSGDKQKIFNYEYFESQDSPYSWEIKKPYFEIFFNCLNKILKPKSVLDIGCAKGYLVYLFYEKGIEAYGVDVSRYAINESPKEIRNRLYILDIEKDSLPFANDYFDLVIGLELLEHLFYFDNMLKELKRVLKNNGYIFFTTPTPKSWDALFDKTHVNVRSRSFWIGLFNKYGFLQIEKKIWKEFKREFIKNYKRNILSIPPVRKVAKILLSLGWFGRFLRRELQVYINFFSPWKSTEMFLLRKR